MTKYVLNSGAVGKNPELSRRYFMEIVKGLGKKPQILICYFARPREVWEEKFVEDQKFIPALLSPDVHPGLDMAMPDKFSEQVRQMDAIYIRGGDDFLLRYWLKQFDLPKLWVGKVVAGTSAGSDALVNSFWTCDWRQCMDGLGILPVKFLPHYQSNYGLNDTRGPVDWEKAYRQLQEYGNRTLPIHALKEGEFVVIEK
jgi:peptidase E